MKKNYIIVIYYLAVVSIISAQPTSKSKKTFVDYVNPMIGTAPSKTISSLKHGNGTENNAQVIPSVTMPFGMTNWTPQTQSSESKCIAPYYYTDSLISGFRGTHWLSGSCTQDYGSFTIMPVASQSDNTPEVHASRYSHNEEITTPYYYKVLLKDYNTVSEITATTRCGLLRFTFNSSDKGFIFIGPNSDRGEGYIKIIPEKNEIIGYNPVHRIYQGWGQKAGFNGYFVVQFDRKIESYGVYCNKKIINDTNEISNYQKLGGFASFALDENKVVVVKVGTSFTSIDEARKNLETETRGFDFDLVKEQLKSKWEQMLSKVSVEGGSNETKTIFYTAMYHSFLAPRIYNNCDGTYPSFAGGDSICNSGNRNYYCDFSIWDTYRALHPLFNILIQDYNADMAKSLLSMAEQGGWLPIFPCWNNYTSAMIGDHAISIIADAFIKGVIDLNDKQYQYLRKNAAETPENYNDYLNGKGVRALKSYIKYGYIPLDDSVKESFHKGEQVSRTLEYAYDDFALSQVAKKMGKMPDLIFFLARSKNYQNVFDPQVECVRGKFADGSFTKEFIKTERMPYITEGTPWQYTWYVPQDIGGLINMMGGREKFNSNLDDFFASGQYWHGNEPDQQVPFLYSYSGQPWKTQKIVQQILKEEYSNDPGGLSGNDDAGQISAWYIFSSMGLYPVCPSRSDYVLTAPSFEKIIVNLTDGKKLVIKADGVEKGKKYIKAIYLNGKPITGYNIKHSDIINGGTLEFEMQNTPPVNN
jgi:predicted alpha-1,2-mannosidase